MKNIIAIFFLTVALSGYAQKQKGDTLVLSIYNNNTRYMLTLADFGPDVLSQSITGEMVAVYDTVLTIKGKADSTKNKLPRFEISRSCDKPLGDVKNKIVIMDLNKDCDVTLLCLNVQRAGAKAFVVVHNSNSNGNIKLPKQGAYKDSIKIPIFTIRKELGENITTMLPTLAGISLRRPQIQALVAPPHVLNMEAQPANERAYIQWENNSGDQNNYFEVEKQNPLTSGFEKIATVNTQKGIGLNQYNLYDENTVEGDNIYRIKLIQLDGSVQYTAPKTVKFAISDEVKIFPNPTQDLLNIALKGYDAQPVEVRVFDMQGKVIINNGHFETSSSSTLSIPLSNKVTNGQYMMLLQSKGKRDVIRTFTVSR
jgi:Secretion system C-terminal sorting domain/PA domain